MTAATRGATVKSALFLGNRRLRLEDKDLLGEGGEGRVYRLDDVAVKIYATPTPGRAEKLRAFPGRLPAAVAAPLELCTDRDGAVVGFSMRAIPGAIDLHRLAQRPWRKGRIDNAAVLRLFQDISAIVDGLHARGVVVGDLNDGNVVVTLPHGASDPSAAPTPWLIDADSMQFHGHPCVVAHERFLDPRLYGIALDRATALSAASDWYALAVLLFGSLLYVHPFGGAHPAHPTMLRRAEARRSVLQPGVKLPSAAERPTILSDDALDWFGSVFDRDRRAPLPAAVLGMRFTRCSCGTEHARRRCPACSTQLPVAPAVRARGQLRATRVFSARAGRIVAASVQNGIKHVHEERGLLFREDGTPVLLAGESPPVPGFFDDPNRIVRIAGQATWVGARGRMARFVGGRMVETHPVGQVRGEVAADAGPGGLVHAEGDRLIRAEHGTRLGQILEGQTHVRVGATLGFAFYRAEAITVAFVFDVQRGGLRQIESFPSLEGRLLGWSTAFDTQHVLVTFATESAGRVRHVAYLIDDRGTILAIDRTATSIGGRTLLGRSVVVATDDGLALLHADPTTQSFSVARVYDDARDLVDADDELLVGAGGLFVVAHDEIHHLSFTR